METIKKTLKERLDRLSRPEPTIRIFNGSEYYFTDTGESGKRAEISVQLSVRFRDRQLRQLKGPILGVFICIALHINEQGLAWPSCALIGKETGYNKETVFKCVKSLELMGYLSRAQLNEQGTGKFRSNSYQLFPKSRRFSAKTPGRNEPCRVVPYTVAPYTKDNQK